MKKALGLCVSGAIGLWPAMKRASIRVLLDKNLETFLRDATFTTTFLLLSLRRFASLASPCPTNCLLCGAYDAKVGSTRASSGDQAF
jgi:hypothetical protein